MTQTEEWRPVPECPEHYEVSNLGRVRSKDRWIKSSRGGGMHRRAGRVLKPHRVNNSQGHRFVVLSVDGKPRNRLVHRLVLEAFVGPCPAHHEARHIDDDAENNRLDNLRWGTRSENIGDRTANGRARGRAAGTPPMQGHRTDTHCGNGHEWAVHGFVTASGRVRCGACARAASRRNYERKRGMVAS